MKSKNTISGFYPISKPLVHPDYVYDPILLTEMTGFDVDLNRNLKEMAKQGFATDQFLYKKDELSILLVRKILNYGQ